MSESAGLNLLEWLISDHLGVSALRQFDIHSADVGLPRSPGEVGNVYGSPLVSHGDLAERSDRAPERGIVDVHIQRQTVAQAVDHPPGHQGIDSAVTPHLSGQLS